MAEYAEAVVLFPGGRGTASMRREAEKAGIQIYDFST
jgi:predicted Rossmann-fold nucleotide-binding protein